MDQQADCFSSIAVTTSPTVTTRQPSRFTRLMSPTQSATSPIANCVEQFSPNPLRLKINSSAEGKLADASGRTIATAGTFTENLIVSPDGKWVAVLSANGPKSVSLLPF